MTAFLLPPVLGLAVGLMVGGRLANFSRLRLRLGWLLPPAVALQVFLVYAAPVPPGQGFEPLRFWLPVTLVPLGVFLGANLRLPGMRLVFLGFAANTLVILANGGLMPTNLDAIERTGRHAAIEISRTHPGIRLPRSKDVLLPIEETRLWWLSDTIVTPPHPRRKAISVGDLAIAAGLMVLAAQAVRGRCQP